MSPNIETCPDLDYTLLTRSHYLYDVVYNPAETLFLQKGRAQGAHTCNGLEMLHLQAEAAWKLWND
jgi:shikimate dehydrogenase